MSMTSRHPVRRFWFGLVVAFAVGAIGFTAFFAFVPGSSALEFENLGPTLGLGSKSLVETIITFVQWFLGILSLIVVIVLLYGGFLWLTARGDANRLDRAKRTIRNGLIGLVIMLIAWAIVLFVINAVERSTGGGGPVACTPGDRIPCFICNAAQVWEPDGSCGLPGPTYYVRWTVPEDAKTDVPLCTWISAGFGGLNPPPANVNDVDPVTVTSSNVVIEDNVGNPVAGTFYTSANTFSFDSTPDLAPTTAYNVTVTSNVKSIGGTAARTKSWNFTTGTTTDPDPPTVSVFGPSGSNVCLRPAIEVEFSEPMLAVSLQAKNVLIFPVDPPGLTITSLVVTAPNRFIAYPSQTLKKNTTYTITLDATTLAQNPDPTVGFKDACGNGLDGNGNGTAEGSPTDNFSWAFTTKDTDDPSCDPVIDSVSPAASYYTNAVADELTVRGANFGVTPDAVRFSPGFLATDFIGASSLCFNGLKPEQPASVACVSSWSDSEVKVKTPAGPLGPPPTGANDGPLQVLKGAIVSNPSSPNTILSPHVDWISPRSGGPGQFATITGKNFGVVAGEVWFRRDDGSEFKGDAPTCAGSWSDTQIIIKVPPGFSEGDLVRVQVKNASLGDPRGRSNLLDFTITDTVGPGLCSIAPICINDPTAANPPVRLEGERFGASRGTSTVNFFNLTARTETPAGSYPSWSDTVVEAGIPASLTFSPYNVYAKVGGVPSNPVSFQVPCGGIPAVVTNLLCDPLEGYPSPSPTPSDSPSACRNSDIHVLYSTDMDDSTIEGPSGLPNYELKKCGTKAAFPVFDDSQCTTDVGMNNPVRFVAGSREGVTIDPFPLLLDRNTWHRMTVKRTVKSAAGVQMPQDFVWHFVTQDTAGPCPIDSISVSPASQTHGFPLPHGDGHENYAAAPFAAGCQLIAASDYTWSWDTADATIAAIDTQSANTAKVKTPAAPKEGTTQVRAKAEGKTGNGNLSIILDYCQKNSDCTKGGLCPNATCNLVAQRCNPEVHGIAPITGPVASTVTIDGCYFGPARGTGKVEFEKSGGPTAEALYVCTTGGWSDRKITVEIPSGFADGDVVLPYVTTDSALNNRGQAPAPPPTFTYSGQCCANPPTCSSFAPVPPGGPPGLCAVSPGIQAQGKPVTLSGERFPSDPGDQVAFGGGVNSDRPSWISSSSKEIKTNVPTGAADGNVYVKAASGAAYCYSNPQLLKVACFAPGLGSPDCPSAGNTCCTGSPLSCQPDANCFVGAAGQTCRITDNPNCQIGAGVVQDPANYTCVSDTGDTLAKVPPPPELPPFGADCRVCCLPGQVSTSGLTCTPNEGVCSGASRGLYCGCKQDEQCGSLSTIGCGIAAPNCCQGRPTVASVAPAGSGICRNAAVQIKLSESIDPSSVSAESFFLYRNGGVASSKNGNEYDSVVANKGGAGVDVGQGSAFSTNDDVRWTYSLSAPSAGDYLLAVKTSNGVSDIAGYGVYHTVNVSLDASPLGTFRNLATKDTSLQVGYVPVSGLAAGPHTVVLEWPDGNNWCYQGDCSVADSNLRLHQVNLIRGSLVAATSRVAGSGVTLSPKTNLEASADYTVVARGGANGDDGYRPDVQSTVGLRSVKGVYLWDVPEPGPDLSVIDRTWSFTTGSTICKLDRLRVTISETGRPPREDTNNLYICAGDTCADDIAPGVKLGNQHEVEIEAVDRDGAVLDPCQFTRTYEDNLGGDVVDLSLSSACVGGACSDGTNSCDAVKHYTSKNDNGSEIVRSSFSSSSFGNASVDVRNTVFLCEKPWPSPPPFHDGNFNFDLKYCRDAGNLPNLELPAVVLDNSPSVPGRDELLREYFFYVVDESGSRTGDAIGIRIIENELNLSPGKWYERFFQRPAPGSGTKVDGYEAITEGRTTYIAGTNWAAGVLIPESRLFTNISVLSYNDNAKPETVAIANQLLGKWFFNTNVTPSEKQAIIYDTKRLADLRDLALKLVDYQKAHTDYPKLSAGSYVAGITTSAWPSWKETLGAELGFSPPVDVHDNHFKPGVVVGERCVAANGFSPDTCWDEGDKIYQCPKDSHVLQYVYEGAGKASLHANLEFTPALGVAWVNDSSYSIDPCAFVPGSSECNCFNFHWPDDDFESFVKSYQQVAAADSVPPGPVVIAAPGPGPVKGKVVVEVDASDNVGVAKVEFLLDGSLAFVDTTNTFTWEWDTTRTVNGSHTLKARAYDRAGNKTDSAEVAVTVDNPPGDTKPPSVSITNPLSGGTVSGSAVSLEASASDNIAVAKVDFHIDNLLVGLDPSAPYSVLWDSTPYTDGSHEIIAVAYDLAGNSAAARHSFFVNNAKDKTPPTVTSVTVPVSPWTGTITVSATATDVGSGVKHVEFSLDSEAAPRFVDTSDPYGWSWDTKTVPDGAHTIKVTAVDQVGLRSVTVEKPGTVANFAGADTTPPTVSVTSPAPGDRVSGTITVTASASDASGINQVRFFLDGVLKASDSTAPSYEWSWSTTTATDGSHTLRAEAIDNASPANSGRSADVRVTVANDSTPPTASITSPSDGATVSGTVTITATASDNVGVVAVSFYYVDLSRLRAFLIGTDSDGGNGWSIDWNTLPVANGSYVLAAVAYDSAGNSGTSPPVNVTVDNPIVAGDLTPPTTPTVTDDGAFTANATQLHATWSAVDPESGIAKYEYSIGIAPGSIDVVGWTDAGLATDVTRTGLALSNGTTYYWNVRAINGAGFVSVVGSSDGITVDVMSPSPVGIISPLDGAYVKGMVTVSAEAIDSISRVAYVRFFFQPDGGFPSFFAADFTAPYEASWNTTGLIESIGYTLFIAAVDNVGNSATASNTGIRVDNTSPTVSITYPPSDGYWFTSIAAPASASASDNLAVDRVEFFVDGTLVGTDTTSPYSIFWNSTTFANSPPEHSMTAKAVDRAGNQTTSLARKVNVTNGLGLSPCGTITCVSASEKCCAACGFTCVSRLLMCPPPC